MSIQKENQILLMIILTFVLVEMKSLSKTLKTNRRFNMAIPKVGFMSTFANSQLLEAGARTGFDSVMVGSGIGAGVGAVNGSFSDYEGVFSGAMKGAVIGGIG